MLQPARCMRRGPSSWSSRRDVSTRIKMSEKKNWIGFNFCFSQKDFFVSFVACFIVPFSHSKVWQLFENNYSPSSLKHSLARPLHTDWNGEWWQQEAATSSRLVFHWSNCINQGCLQRVHIVQWWMTAGNYATAQKHHTSHLWCADTAVESDRGLNHSRKKHRKKKKVPAASWASACYVFER